MPIGVRWWCLFSSAPTGEERPAALDAAASREHDYPHFAQSPSANATGERALVNRSPFERVAIAGCFISACLAARCTWLDPSIAEAFLACALDAWQDASRRGT